MSEGLKLWFGLHIPAIALSVYFPWFAIVALPLLWIGDVLIAARAILS